MPTVPFLNKTCPFGYSLDPNTGLCTLLNFWTVSGLILGAGSVGVGLGTLAGYLQDSRQYRPNPLSTKNAAIVGASIAGGTLATMLIARAFSAPDADPAPIPPDVVAARKQQDAQPTIPVTSSAVSATLPQAVTAPALPPCETGCTCIRTQLDWCAAGKAYLMPNFMPGLVSMVNANTLPFPNYDFTANVAQWIGFFSYEADPAGDTWCSPPITYATGKGDCEDLSLLAASVLLSGGINAGIAVGIYNDPSGSFGHAWVEGTDSQGFFLIEATNGKMYRNARPLEYKPSLQVRKGTCTSVA